MAVKLLSLQIEYDKILPQAISGLSRYLGLITKFQNAIVFFTSLSKCMEEFGIQILIVTENLGHIPTRETCFNFICK